jgi:hypothetical protein
MPAEQTDMFLKSPTTASRRSVSSDYWFLDPRILADLKFEKAIDGSFKVGCRYSNTMRTVRPEEVIRHLVLLRLVHEFGYDPSRVRLEYPVQMGVSRKYADIVIVNNSGGIDIIVEVKLAAAQGVEQVKSYCLATNALYAAVMSLSEAIVFSYNGGHRRFSDRARLPFAHELAEAQVPEPSDAGSGDNPRQPESGADSVNVRGLHLSRLRQTGSGTFSVMMGNAEVLLDLHDVQNVRRVRQRALERNVPFPIGLMQREWAAAFDELRRRAASEVPPDAHEPRPAELTLLDKIRSIQRRVTLKSTGLARDLTIGEMCAVAAGKAEIAGVSRDDAKSAAARLGLRFINKDEVRNFATDVASQQGSSITGLPENDPLQVDGFFIHTTHKDLSAVTRPFGDYAKILKRHPAARLCHQSIHISSGVTSRAIWLPASVVLGEGSDMQAPTGVSLSRDPSDSRHTAEAKVENGDVVSGSEAPEDRDENGGSPLT